MPDTYNPGSLVYTGTARLSSPFYFGDVTLHLDARSGNVIVFTPQLSFIDGFSALRNQFEEEAKQPYALEDVRIILPLGSLYTKEIRGLRFHTYSLGSLSIFSTPVSNLFDLRDKVGISSLRLYPEAGFLQFEVENGVNSGVELVFSSHDVKASPPFSVLGGKWQVRGDERFVHFISQDIDETDFEDLQIAWSLTGGAYVHKFIERCGSDIKIHRDYPLDASMTL